MRRRLLTVAGCLLLVSGLSGCCVFCPWHCGVGGHCGGSPYGGGSPYSGGAYGACVVPRGCPECATGIYAAQADPVHRARSMRLERMRRQRGYTYGRGPRGRRQQRMHSGHGYAGGYGDSYMDMDVGYGYDEGMPYDDMAYDDMAYGYGGGIHMDDGMGLMTDDSAIMMGSGWMPSSSPCNCQDGSNFAGEFVDGGLMDGSLMEGDWVEATPNSMPTPAASPHPGNAAPQSTPMTEPQAMPREEVVPNPMPVTQEQYYFPAPQLVPSSLHSDGPSTPTVEASSAGSPIQPVLWVPSGL